MAYLGFANVFGHHDNVDHYEDGASLTAFFICSMLCFGFSSTYHLFSCHSQPVHKLTLTLDFLGIFCQIFGYAVARDLGRVLCF